SLGLEPRYLLEGANARAIRAAEGIEPVPDEDAVGAGEGDDGADGGERDQVQEGLERGLARVLEPAEGAERATEGHHQVEGDAGGAQGLGGVLAAGLVRVEDGGRGGKRLRNGVVVDDDHVHAELPSTRDLGDAGDAAVQGAEEPGALPGGALDGPEIKPAALVEPMRDVRPGRCADRVEEEREQRGGADPVDVVVAVEGDLLPFDDGAGEALDRGGHALHPEGVGKVGELVREETGGVLWFSDAASDEDARGERVQADLDGKTAGGATLGLDVS